MFIMLSCSKCFVCLCLFQYRHCFLVGWCTNKSYVIATSDLWLFIHASNLLPLHSPSPLPYKSWCCEQDGKSRVLAFASRRLQPSEKNSSLYSSMKLEFLAMKWAIMDKFRHYLLGGKFKVITDNNPLTYFRSAKLGALEERWASQLAQFDFDIQ